MEAILLIVALLSVVIGVALLIGNAINHGLGVLLTFKGIKKSLIFFGIYAVCYIIFLFISN
ncbi:hypothetical protein D8M04_13925 [Oceanobacillus piezotolerans]|uniref:Uncharacterized protein n=1 Tax=Oceanobacillus piezotolerans TaxID=2448030 RepID=A0A498D3A5_9BACI|nr:hypothetical protein [Oceanobacillus piezotolerans]RLL42652.1 hypothetical protein D8M04_13925 [Oceanobacillus piezotolerans]